MLLAVTNVIVRDAYGCDKLAKVNPIASNFFTLLDEKYALVTQFCNNEWIFQINVYLSLVVWLVGYLGEWVGG